MSPTVLPAQHERLRVRVRGAVQGVGFRPFVHGLAARYNLSGFVLNDDEGVLAEVEGVAARSFLGALCDEPPPLARIAGVEVTYLPGQGQMGFSIRASTGCGTGHTAIVPDSATCTACLDEMLDPSSRFYLYPFVTCTDCGPRFTIIRRMPYDRHNTSMSDFPRCADCARDFADPTNRRFQAEASACPACGPQLSHSIAHIQSALLAGKIVALKGLGGFHLFCDACNESAVQTLRQRKDRPKKPFAVMLANAACAEHFATATYAERALLRHIARPIVMIRTGAGLAPSVAPGLRHVGIMLPSAPVHHLLFHRPGQHMPSRPRALVATSANRQGEPLVIEDEEASQTLTGLADLVVTHDRPILARADDSVMAIIAGGPAFIRRSRGFVPEPIDLGQDGPSVLAVGGHLKAAICVTRGREAFVSQHVGDLSTPETIRFYEETAARLLATLGVTPEMVACDLHPDYRSTRFAEASGLPVLRVQHHAAHVAAVAAEHHLEGAVLGAALDGQGYGADGGAWGGELLLLEGARWRRQGHLLPLPLPGGDRAAQEPWRMGVAMLAVLDRGREASDRFASMPLAASLATLLAAQDATAAKASTTSLGRLFDAAAALLGVCTMQSYEGQAAMELEALVGVPRSLPGGYRIEAGQEFTCAGHPEAVFCAPRLTAEEAAPLRCSKTTSGRRQAAPLARRSEFLPSLFVNHMLDFRPLMSALLTPGLSAREGAELFHGTLIDGLVAWISAAAAARGQTRAVLGGGCLLNAVLTEGLVAGLRACGINPYLPRAVPANDGGLSFGQAAMARAYLQAPDCARRP